MIPSPVSNVSDTARWVAVYRARESARPDALFRDPYADRLAGDRGRAIASLMPRQARNGWPMVARTLLIDERVAEALGRGCDCVLNLAAGLDTRPYRLDLPASLRWIEADLPALLDEKAAVLAGATPRCRLSRVAVDLTDAAARSMVLDQALAGSSRALVITEGLLVYLDAEEVVAISASLLERPQVATWIIDLASPAVLASLRRGMGRHLANAPMKFAPPEGLAFFEKLGWAVDSAHSLLHTAARHRRLPWPLRLASLLPQPDPRRLAHARWAGVVQLSRPVHR